MLEKPLAYLALAILIFMAGWWSSLHQDQFWARAGRFGTYVSRQIDRTPVCPPNFVCAPIPSPTP